MKKINLKHVVVASALAVAATIAFGVTKAEASINYDATTDTIKNNGTGGYVALLKKDEATALKGTAFKLLSGTSISFGKTGLKLAENKDAYLTFAAAKPTAVEEKDKKTYSKTFTVARSKYDKVIVTFDYTSVDRPSSSAIALVQGKLGRDEAKEVFKKSGTAKVKDEVLTAKEVLWSPDGTKYWGALNTAVSTSDTVTTYLDGEYLAKNSGKTVYVKVAGVSATNSAAGATRPTKLVKVKIAKVGKAPSVKIDVNKLSMNLKHGYDFKISASGATKASWQSILPYHKEGTKTTLRDSILETDKATPVADKKSTEYKALATTYKVKEIPLDMLVNIASGASVKGDGAGIKQLSTPGSTFLIRKSATAKALATPATEIKVTSQYPAPKIATTGATLKFATGTTFGFTMPSITKDATDPGASVYEMAAIETADLNSNTVNWATVKWKTAKAGAKIKDTTKTKYALTTATDPKETKEATFNSSTVTLVIRRKGVAAKGKTGTAVLPSNYSTITVTGTSEYEFTATNK